MCLLVHAYIRTHAHVIVRLCVRACTHTINTNTNSNTINNDNITNTNKNNDNTSNNNNNDNSTHHHSTWRQSPLRRGEPRRLAEACLRKRKAARYEKPFYTFHLAAHSDIHCNMFGIHCKCYDFHILLNRRG